VPHRSSADNPLPPVGSRAAWASLRYASPNATLPASDVRAGGAQDVFNQSVYLHARCPPAATAASEKEVGVSARR
jgi:hypothetical protein